MAQIELVDLRGQLEAVGGIHLPQHRARRLGLADFGIQRGQLAVHRRADGQRFDTGIGDVGLRTRGLAGELGGAHPLLDLARGDGRGAQLHVVVIFLLLLLIGAGRDGIAVEQNLVARQIVLQLADLVLDVQQVVLVLEARLLEGELLGRDLQLQRRDWTG